MKHAGVAVSITTFTDVIAFLVGRSEYVANYSFRQQQAQQPLLWKTVVNQVPKQVVSSHKRVSACNWWRQLVDKQAV